MKKFYKLEKERNSEEKRTGKASYKSIIDRYFSDLVLCNDIIKVDYELEDIIGTQFDEEWNDPIDIYQYYIANITEWNIEQLQELMAENNDNSILLMYSNVLNVYILGVTHFGTSWDYVPTSIELTEDINEA